MSAISNLLFPQQSPPLGFAVQPMGTGYPTREQVAETTTHTLTTEASLTKDPGVNAVRPYKPAKVALKSNERTRVRRLRTACSRLSSWCRELTTHKNANPHQGTRTYSPNVHTQEGPRQNPTVRTDGRFPGPHPTTRVNGDINTVQSSAGGPHCLLVGGR